MAPITIMRKLLTKTDIGHRLAFPTAQLHLLPPFEGGANWVEFAVGIRHGEDIKAHVFRCVVRRGVYKKPVIEAGWRDIVQEKELREGDLLIFYRDDDGNYILEFQRSSVRFRGQAIWLPF